MDPRDPGKRCEDGMKPRIQLRRASQNDCLQLGLWNYALIRDEGQRNPMTAIALEQRMRAWVATGEYVVQMIERDSKPVGYVCWRTDGPRDVVVRQFYVMPDARRQACGREAVLALRTAAWPTQARITLECMVINNQGLAFWRACGFTDYSITLEQLPSDNDPRYV